MAIRKIRKISSWSFLAIVLISLVVLGIYYFGGIVDPAAEMPEPIYTGLLLDWTYAVFTITLVIMLGFAVWQIARMLKDDPKSAIAPISVAIAFAVMFIGTYTAGDPTPLTMVGYEGAHNVEFWLKLTDMWLFSTYLLMGIICITLAYFYVAKFVKK